MFNYMLYCRLKDYMFRPVVAIIRSLSFDSLKIEELKNNLMSLVIFISLIVCSTCFEH